MIAAAKKIRPWTEEADDVLRRHYPIDGPQFCADRLLRTTAAIQQRASKLGVYRNGCSSTRPSLARGPAKIGDNERTLWQEYISGGRTDDSLRNSICLLYLPRLNQLARRLNGTLPGQAMYDELVQDGFQGLVDAAQKFAPDRGANFWTFAVLRVRGAMLDGLRSRDWVPRLARKIQRRATEMRAAIQQELGRAPTADELSERGIDARDLQTPLLESIEIAAYQGGDREHNTTLAELLGAVCKERRQQEVDAFFREALRSLSMQEQTIVYLYVTTESTMRQIAGVIGLSESRVSQLISNSLRQLRVTLNRDDACRMLQPI